MPIHTDQGPPLHNKYMSLLQFFSEGMKDKEAVELIYKIKDRLENIEDRNRLVALIEDL